MKPIVKETRVDKLFDFTDKVTLITGAGGVGEAFARGYAKQGARVVLLDVFEKSCLNLIAKLNDEGLEADFFIAAAAHRGCYAQQALHRVYSR